VNGKTIMTFDPDGRLPTMSRYDAKGNLLYYAPARPYQGHGTQIEYLAADGRAFLWYPGNKVVLSGNWRTETEPRTVTDRSKERHFTVASLCFRYKTTRINPQTGESGANWSCTPSLFYLRRKKEEVTGDVFGLSRQGAPPFILDREATTLDALRQRVGTR
jgi:hypothetical protein